MKKNIFKKIITVASLIFLLVILIVPLHSIFAQTPAPTTTPISTSIYKFLAPLSGDTTFDPSQKNALSVYLNMIIKILIGIAAVLAMIMIVMGGTEYMMSDVVSNKAEGKKRIINAIVGLLIALSAYLLLFTINPNLLKTIDPSDNTQFTNTTLVDYPGDPEGTGALAPIIGTGSTGTASQAALQAMGIYCPGSGGVAELSSIAQSFLGKVTYSNTLRNTIDASIPTVYLDCSSFVTKVYQCAGLTSPAGGAGTTSGIFASHTPVPLTSAGTLDISKLQVGDLVGWTASDFGTPMGHVLMYIGGGQFINSVGAGHATNASIKITSTIMSKIKWINPIP